MLGDKYWTIRSDGDTTEFCAVGKVGPTPGRQTLVIFGLFFPIVITLSFWEGAIRKGDLFGDPLAGKMVVLTVLWVALLIWAMFPRIHGIRLKASPGKLSVLRYDRGRVKQDLTFNPKELVLRMATRNMWVPRGGGKHRYRAVQVYELWGITDSGEEIEVSWADDLGVSVKEGAEKIAQACGVRLIDALPPLQKPT